jgi:hypothetical protein
MSLWLSIVILLVGLTVFIASVFQLSASLRFRRKTNEALTLLNLVRELTLLSPDVNGEKFTELLARLRPLLERRLRFSFSRDGMEDLLSWAIYLGEGERLELFMELYRLAGFVGDRKAVIELLNAWQATADIEASKDLAEFLRYKNKRYREWQVA